MMRLTIPSLTQAYRSGELTPRRMVAHVLEQLELHADNPVWITRCSEELLYARADELAQLGPDSLPLYGIPFAIKDNIDLAGVPTTAACPDAAFVPDTSAHVVQRLLGAGAIAVGKTNMDQFATGLVGTRSPYGTCRNAFNRDYLSGGSSSGSALAVALGTVSFALGTDTAGSGRVPAAFNNLIGYKPTLGRLSNRGMLPACRSLDAMSVFALTARDALTIGRVAAGFDPSDPWSRPAQLPSGRLWSQRPLRLAVPATGQLEFFGNAEYASLFAEAVEALRASGAILQTVDVEPMLQAARLLYEGPWVAERYLAIAPLLESAPESIWPVTRQIIEAGRNASARDAFAAQYRLKDLTAAARAVWEKADVLLLPTAGTHYRIDAEQADPLRLNANLGRYTNFVNLLDLCAVAVPAGFTLRGLPFGVTLISQAWHDEDVLALAARLHSACVRQLGATAHELREEDEPGSLDEATIDVAVCGAHMQGLPLNGQLTSRGAWRELLTTTAPCYRLYALPGGPPFRPGMVRVASDGAAIEVEVWRMPREHFGSFVQGIPAPLGIGRVKLESGTEVPGFLCEAHALHEATDITAFGGWRRWLARDADG